MQTQHAGQHAGSERPTHIAERAGRVAMATLSAFSRNRGLLLAGGVAYNALLSLVPLMAIVLLGLSAFFDRELILQTVRAELRMVAPGNVEAIVQTVTGLLDAREVISVVMLAVLLFLSSLAFRMVEDAFAVIFGATEDASTRPFWLRALLPYLFVLVLTVALFLLTAATVAVEAVLTANSDAAALGLRLGVGSARLLRLGGLVGEAVLFTALYKVLPQRHIPLHRALLAGGALAVVWDVARGLLAWYLGNVSMVGAVYGSLATVVILLLTLEVASILLLLGAQVIAVLEQRDGAAAARAMALRAAAADDDAAEDAACAAPGSQP